MYLQASQLIMPLSRTPNPPQDARKRHPWSGVSEPKNLPALTIIGALGLVALATIDRFVASRQEGYLSGIATTRADHAIHLAWFALTITRSATATPETASAAGLLARCSTGRTTSRCVGQTAPGEKFLLARRKRKLLITVATTQNLIHKSHISLLFSVSRARARCNTVYRAVRKRFSPPGADAPYNVGPVYHTFQKNPFLQPIMSIYL